MGILLLREGVLLLEHGRIWLLLEHPLLRILLEKHALLVLLEAARVVLLDEGKLTLLLLLLLLLLHGRSLDVLLKAGQLIEEAAGTNTLRSYKTHEKAA